VPTRSPAGVFIGPRRLDLTTVDRGCEVKNLDFTAEDLTTVDRGCEVKNLDFTAEGRGATLAS
jgi:hypothetical protein